METAALAVCAASKLSLRQTQSLNKLWNLSGETIWKGQKRMQIILSFWINICKVVYVYIYVNLSLLSLAGLIKFFLNIMWGLWKVSMTR